MDIPTPADANDEVNSNDEEGSDSDSTPIAQLAEEKGDNEEGKDDEEDDEDGKDNEEEDGDGTPNTKAQEDERCDGMVETIIAICSVHRDNTHPHPFLTRYVCL